MRSIPWCMSAILVACAAPESKTDDGSPADGVSTDTDTDVIEWDSDLPVETDSFSVSIEPTLDVFEQGVPAELTGRVVDAKNRPDETVAGWFSTINGPLGNSTVQASGEVVLDTSVLSPGFHDITLQGVNPDGEEAEATFPIAVCTWGEPEDFDIDIAGAGWQIYGNAYWDPGGWLELTGNQQSASGQIYNVAERIAPGDLNIRFDIFTGGGINSGADGFALSIINVEDVAELETVIAAASNGGCLSYGVSGGCGELVVDAFHIEFDTWYNGEWFLNDPVQENHVAINLDGNPGLHPLWAAIPTLEDEDWHEVTVITQGDWVTVTIDGTEVIKGEIPDLDFEGGYLGFSGTTGWATNWHRFDNLHVLDECTVPDEF